MKDFSKIKYHIVLCLVIIIKKQIAKNTKRMKRDVTSEVYFMFKTKNQILIRNLRREMYHRSLKLWYFRRRLKGIYFLFSKFLSKHQKATFYFHVVSFFLGGGSFLLSTLSPKL